MISTQELPKQLRLFAKLLELQQICLAASDHGLLLLFLNLIAHHFGNFLLARSISKLMDCLAHVRMPLEGASHYNRFERSGNIGACASFIGQAPAQLYWN